MFRLSMPICKSETAETVKHPHQLNNLKEEKTGQKTNKNKTSSGLKIQFCNEEHNCVRNRYDNFNCMCYIFVLHFYCICMRGSRRELAALSCWLLFVSFYILLFPYCIYSAFELYLYERGHVTIVICI